MKTKEEILVSIVGETRYKLNGTKSNKEIIQAMETYASQSHQWISVKDRLPELDESTIFAFGYRSKPVVVLCECIPHIAEYCFMPNKQRIGWVQINAPSQNITHWMPLPNPPKP